MKSIRIVFSFIIVALVTVLCSLEAADVAYSAISSTEALSRMQRLQEQDKVPAYVLEQGIYKYTEGVRVAHVQGKNVFMRSQPLKNARIVTKLTHVDLEYLGEWKNPKNGERWLCVTRNGKIGWIYGQYVQLTSNEIRTNVVNTENTNDKSSSANSRSDGNTQLASKSDSGYKRNKDCIDDPCGAIGGFLLLSPFLFLFNNYTEKKEEEKKQEEKRLNDIRNTQCPNYQSSKCKWCKYLGRRAFSDKAYSKCNYYEAYVNTEASPQFNASNLLLIDESYECCPYYSKTTCRDCPLIDFRDEFCNSFKCSYFKKYVEPEGSPQYNSIGYR